MQCDQKVQTEIYFTIFKYDPHSLENTPYVQQNRVPSASVSSETLHWSHFLQESRAPFVIQSGSLIMLAKRRPSSLNLMIQNRKKLESDKSGEQ